VESEIKRKISKNFLAAIILFFFSIYPVFSEDSTETVYYNEIRTEISQARKSLAFSRKMKYLGVFMMLSGCAVILSHRTPYNDYIGGSLILAGFSFQFWTSLAYEKEADEKLALLEKKKIVVRKKTEKKIPSVPLSAKLISEKFEGLKNIKGATVKSGIEIDRVVILAESRSLGLETKKKTLSEKGKKILHKIAEIIKDYRDEKVKVVGHTQDYGDEKLNLEISKSNAEAVKDYYVKRENISPENIEAIGKGSAEPLFFGDNQRGKNNRVETIFSAPAQELETKSVAKLNDLKELEGVGVIQRPQAFETRIIASEKAVYFERGSDAIEEKSYPLLERIADVLEIVPEFNITIKGYPDEISGDVEKEKWISQRRAESVLKYFTQVKGFSADRFTVLSFEGTEDEDATKEVSNRSVVINLRWILK